MWPQKAWVFSRQPSICGSFVRQFMRISFETRIKKNKNASKKISSTHQKKYICIKKNIQVPLCETSRVSCCKPRSKKISVSKKKYHSSRRSSSSSSSSSSNSSSSSSSSSTSSRKKKGIVGSKGNRFKNKSGWGGAGGRAQRLPPQCVPREKHIGTSLNGYIASKNEKIKKEAHRHKSRWISTKIN